MYILIYVVHLFNAENRRLYTAFVLLTENDYFYSKNC